MLVQARRKKENENKDMVKSGAKDKLRRVLQEDGAKGGNTELWEGKGGIKE